MKNFQPLNEEEQKIIQEAQRILGNSSTIPCTACHYCVEGCPKQIKIPDIFSAMNKQLGNGQMEEAKMAYRSITFTSVLNANAYGARGTFRMKGTHHYKKRDGEWIAVNE